MERIQSFKEFYPFYLTEHRNPTSRVLHFTGTSLFFVFLIAGIVTGNANLFWLCPLMGYGFAWVGHFFFEKNKPATFNYPLWSLASDFKLYFQILAGKQKLTVK
ncbi:MAG: DUF962 domain-containing protein [Bacteroidota bacterium]